MLLKLGFKGRLKLGNILPKIGQNSFEITLEFSSQT
jgi:hypothetical protein